MNQYLIRVETVNHYKVQVRVRDRGRWKLCGYCEDKAHAEMYLSNLREDSHESKEHRMVKLDKPKITTSLV